MNNRESRRYEMFGRVTAFGKVNSSDFAAGGEAAKHFAELGRVAADLAKAGAGQQSSGVTAKAVLLDALRLDLQNISRTARAIAQDTPGFDDKFGAPASFVQSALLVAARGYLAELQKPAVVARFDGHELPADFVPQLIEDVAAIGDAREEQEVNREAGVASTATVGQLIAAGMAEVNYLDAIMHNKYTRVPERLRTWQSASHIERAAQREKKVSEDVSAMRAVISTGTTPS